MAPGLWCMCKLGKEGILALKVCPYLSTQGLTFGMLSLVTLGSGRDKHRLKMTKDSLKDFFKEQGCWGLPQQLLATDGVKMIEWLRGLRV